MDNGSLWLSLLVGSVVLSCARTELLLSSDGGMDAAAIHEADVGADATATAPAPATAGIDGAAGPPRACTISASSYDRSCIVASDCVAVAEVWGCDGCVCATGAINKDDEAQYRRDFAGVAPSKVTICNCPCEAATPLCCKGVCTNSCGGCEAR